MTGEHYLGIDGGQSSTTALIGDASGRVIGMGRGGPCNHVQASEGKAKFTNAIRGCLDEACRQAGLDAGVIRFASACLGFSGGPADKEAILREILPADRMFVTHDALIALVGAMAGDPGIIVIAGTGSIAFGRNAESRTARAGGWGFVFGDEGGGFDLTRQALRAILRHEEGWGPPTALRELLLKETGARDANDLLHRFYTAGFPRPRVASYSKLVDRAAQNEDRIAVDLLNESARQLSTLANAVRHQLFKPADAVRVAPIGGVFRSKIMSDKFRATLQMNERVQVIEPVYGPAAGALIEAYRRGGLPCAISQVPEIEK